VPLVVSHVVLSVLAYGAFPDRLVYNMKVGADALAERSSGDTLCSGELNGLVEFLASPEYDAARGGSDLRYVHALYQDILGRTPPPREEAHWLDQLRRHSRSQVAASLLTCREGRLQPNTVFFLTRAQILGTAKVPVAATDVAHGEPRPVGSTR
jgi:hypothetical protein